MPIASVEADAQIIPSTINEIALPPAVATAFAPAPASALSDVVVTHELRTRPIREMHMRAETAGMHTLANACAGGPVSVVRALARFAVDLCGAGTGGVSTLEAASDGDQCFRWTALAGALASFEGGTTPRDWSPCGVCLQAGEPMLYSYPDRCFSYFQGIEPRIVEGLVIPMWVDGVAVGTIWIVSHDTNCRFDLEDVRVMTNLGAFAANSFRISRLRGEDKHRQPGHQEARSLVWREYVRRIVLGDHTALAALYDETASLIYTTAIRTLRVPEDAEEVALDVYSQAWVTAGTFDPARGSVGAWLVNIARSRAVDRLRAKATRTRFEKVLCRNSQRAGSLRASSTIQGRIELMETLGALSCEQRLVIDLAYFDGLSATEIAERIGAPLGTVKSRIRAGLMVLRRSLCEVGF